MIPLGSPDIREEDIGKVVEVLRSGMLVQGQKVAELERNVSNYLSVSHVLAASSGTATLHLALLASGIGHGDEVIVPSFSYIATVNVVEIIGARPVFVDIDIKTYCIDIKKIEAAITRSTKAIISVHEFGLMADMEAVMAIAKKHSLVVIEDAACALGASDSGILAGTMGNFGSFSLHPRKNITSGEGGVLVCKDTGHAEMVSMLRNHGGSDVDGRKEFLVAGYNYRLTDIQAALAVSQFSRLEEILVKKQRLAGLYHEHFSHDAVKLPRCPDGKFHTWQSFHVLLDEAVDRDGLILKLRDVGVEANVGAQCLPAQEYYMNKYGLNSLELFPNGLSAWKQGLVLPMHEKLREKDVLYVIKKIKDNI